MNTEDNTGEGPFTYQELLDRMKAQEECTCDRCLHCGKVKPKDDGYSGRPWTPPPPFVWPWWTQEPQVGTVTYTSDNTGEQPHVQL